MFVVGGSYYTLKGNKVTLVQEAFEYTDNHVLKGDDGVWRRAVDGGVIQTDYNHPDMLFPNPEITDCCYMGL